MTTITIDRALLEQALEALEQSETTVPYEGFGMAHREAERKHQAAITALRAALAQEPAPMPPFPPVPQRQRGCPVCGAHGNATGYVCPRYDCPTRVTCGGTV